MKPIMWVGVRCHAAGDLAALAFYPCARLNARSSHHAWRGKGASGQAAALRWSGLRFAPTPLCCSVSWPAAELTSLALLAAFKQTAASQSLIRAARGGHKPCAARRSRGALQPARTRLCNGHWLSPTKTPAVAARQAVPGGGDFCGDEKVSPDENSPVDCSRLANGRSSWTGAACKASPEVGARSAHPHLTRRGCLSGVSEANVASSAARPQDDAVRPDAEQSPAN